MEKLKMLRTIVWMASVLLLVELAMLVVMIRPTSFFVWATLAVIALMCVYLIRLSLGLIGELQNREKQDNENKLPK